MNAAMETIIEYWHEGLHPRTRFGRIIVPLIALKLAFILILWVLFFGPSTKPETGPQGIAAAVFNLSTSPVQEPRP